MAGKAQAVSPSSQLSPSRAGDRWRAYGNMDAGSIMLLSQKADSLFHRDIAVCGGGMA
jgi:hypothetical protein